MGLILDLIRVVRPSLIFILFLLLLAYLAGRRSQGWGIRPTVSIVAAWGLAVLLVLGMTFLPTYRWIDAYVSPFAPPFDAYYAHLIDWLPSLALIWATLLLSQGLGRFTPQQASGAVEEAAGPRPTQPSAWVAAASLAFSAMLFGSAFYHLYYQSVWDSTTDSIDFLLLYPPLVAVLISSLFLSEALRNRKWGGGFYYMIFLAAAVVSVYIYAKQTDYYQLTERHAARLSRGVEAYYARQGHYPASLRQLTSWTMLALPKPVIMQGIDWCYQAGPDYYRLGYVSRGPWSSPELMVREVRAAGVLPRDLPGLCQAEIAEIDRREPIFYVIQ